MFRPAGHDAAAIQRIESLEAEVKKQDGLRRADVNMLFAKVNEVSDNVSAIRASMETFADNTKSQLTRLDEKLGDKADKKK